MRQLIVLWLAAPVSVLAEPGGDGTTLEVNLGIGFIKSDNYWSSTSLAGPDIALGVWATRRGTDFSIPRKWFEPISCI